MNVSGIKKLDFSSLLEEKLDIKNNARPVSAQFELKSSTKKKCKGAKEKESLHVFLIGKCWICRCEESNTLFVL